MPCKKSDAYSAAILFINHKQHFDLNSDDVPFAPGINKEYFPYVL